MTKAMRLLAAIAACSVASVAQSQTSLSFPNPPAGKAQIVVYRLGTIIGVAMGCSGFENGIKLFELGAGRYDILNVQPGRHILTNRSGGLEISLDPGERRFVMCKITTGMFAGTPSFSIADEASFRTRFPKLKPQSAAVASKTSLEGK